MISIAQNATVVKLADRKKAGLRVAQKMRDIGEIRRALRMEDCGTMIRAAVCPDCGRTKLTSANFCRDKVCPTCAWRLSLKRFGELCSMIGWVLDNDDYKAALLTLTVRNCKAGDLAYTLRKMSADWNRMCSRRSIKRLWAGWARTLEITYNAVSNTWHPHYHILLLADSGADDREMRLEFTRQWQTAARLAYTPITEYHEVEPRERKYKGTHGNDVVYIGAESMRLDSNVLMGALAEVSKYLTKPSDLEAMPITAFREFVAAIHNTRMTSFGGILKEARAALAMPETADELTDDDDALEGIHCECGALMQEYALRWSFSTAQYEAIQAAEVKIAQASDTRGGYAAPADC